MALDMTSYVLGQKSSGGSGGTTNYNDLTNKPAIDSVELYNNTTAMDLDVIPQYSSLPTADDFSVGKIVQYRGETNGTYTNGYFYKCVYEYSEEQGDVWRWENVQVQGSGDVHYIVDGDGNKVYFAVEDNFSYNGASNAVKSAIIQMVADYNNSKNPALCISMASQSNSSSLTAPSYFMNGIYTIYRKYSNTVEIMSTQNHRDIYNYFTLRDIYKGYKVEFTDNTFTEISTIKKSNVAVNEIAKVLTTNNIGAFTPTADYNPATKKYVDDQPTTYTGYDATKTQILEQINGTLTWVDDPIGAINTVLATLTTPSNGGA